MVDKPGERNGLNQDTTTNAPSKGDNTTKMSNSENGSSTRKRKETDASKASKKEIENQLQHAISCNWVVPDGGYGWVVMVCSIVISVIVDGVTYTFGVFLNDLEIAFEEPKSTITLANSLQVGLYLISGPIVSAMTNKFGCRPVIIVGSVLAGTAFILSAASPNIYVLIATYGVLGGIGFGMMYLPSVVAVSVYFDKKRALATGIAVCGSGIGTFALAPLSEYLLMEFNWRWTLVLLGGIIFNGVIGGALIRPMEIRFTDNFKHGKKNDASVEDNLSMKYSISSDSGNKNSKSSNNSRNTCDRKIPESVPLITLTDETETTLLVAPAPGSKINGNTLTVTNAAPSSSEPPASRGREVMFFSSTPNFSSTQAYSRSSDMSTVKTKKSESLTEKDILEVGGILKGRNRSNTVDNFNKFSQAFNAARESRAEPKVRSHAPIGLAFIGVSDIHINKIRDDIAVPLSRRDINRSMMQIEFGGANDGFEMVKTVNTDSEMNSITSMDDVTTKEKGLWGCVPESARETLEDMLNFGIFKERRYWFVIAGNFLCMLGFYVPFVYIPGRAADLGISDDKGSFLISIIGITNLVGRVATGVLVNYLPIDSVLVTSVALAVGGVVTMVCPICESYETLIVISAIFGLCVAAYISLCSILLCELLGVRNLTNAFGYVVLFRGFACIMGPPIAGALIDSTGMFDPAFYVGGAMILFGAISHFCLLIPCMKSVRYTS